MSERDRVGIGHGPPPRPLTKWSFFLVGAAAFCVGFLLTTPTVAAAGSHPQLQVSTEVLVPGSTITLSGTGWPHLQSVVATICGADAVAGTADCAVTETATMVATHLGLLYSRLNVVVPPVPCPCVVLVTSVNSALSEKIPVKIQGVATAPVRGPIRSRLVQPEITGLRVVGSTTLASMLGFASHRTVVLRVHDPGPTPMSLVLVGRWGKGGALRNVIEMPVIARLGPGQSREVRANFTIGSFSFGNYRVEVEAQLIGYPPETTASSETSQWPILLFVCVVLALLALLALYWRLRRRMRESRAARYGQEDAPPPEVPAKNDLLGHEIGEAEPIRGSSDLSGVQARQQRGIHQA